MKNTKHTMFRHSHQNNASISNVKSNYVEIVLDYDKFITEGIEPFIPLIYKRLSPGVIYSYITKISKDDNLYLSLHETQKHFKLDMSNDTARFEGLQFMINSRLDKILDNYYDVLNGEIEFIILQFTSVSPIYDDEYTIENINDVKKLVPKRYIKNIIDKFSVFDPDILEYKGFNLDLKYYNGNCYFNHPDLKDFVFDNMEFKNSDDRYKMIKNKGNTYVVYISNLEDGKVFKQCLNLFGDSLFKIYEYKDKYGNLVRKDGNNIITFKDKKVLDTRREINFKSIYKKLTKNSDRNSLNLNFGTIDLETYKSSDNISYCYAIGFYTKDTGAIMKYINKDLSSYNLVHELMDEIFKIKDNKSYKFYCHNLGGFDAPFIIKSLISFNETTTEINNKYKLDILTRDSSIIKLTIKRRIKKVKVVNNKLYTSYVERKVIISDSYAILPQSLRTLCSIYKIDDSKTYFPYDFVSDNTLEYIGITPDKDYYKVEDKDILMFNTFYNKNYSDYWNLKEECLKYLKIDLISLHKVLSEVNISLFKMFGVQMTDSNTVSSLAMNIFFKNFYKNDNLNIPLVSSAHVYKDIYNAYYGGRVEVFRPTNINNEKLYYYDVNSLYPYASLNDIPGLNWTFRNYIIQPNIQDLFGFFYCKVSYDKGYLGLLPYRTNKGSLKYPLGQWYGWYFSEELKMAKKHGYKIEVIKGYETSRAGNIFNEFVNNVYKMKTDYKNISEKNVAKLILNSLIGRFGMNPEKSSTKILTEEEHMNISITRKLKNSIRLDDNNYLDTFFSEISRDICNEFNLDYIKVINTPKFNFKNARSIKNTNISISTAAAILSYSRIYMLEVILEVLNKGGNIYYTDTDSLVTNIKLDASKVDSTVLGKFKLEHEIVKCYFLSDKTYLIENNKGVIIKKAKGVKESSLSKNDYIKLYNMEIFKGPIKSITKKDYKLGSVDISEKLVTLNIDKYNKRSRVFEGKKWINTKPKWVNDIKDLSLILYKPKETKIINYI